MKKARTFLGLFLAIILSVSIFPGDLARADTVTNDKVDRIVNEYLNGIYDSEEALNFRKELTDKYTLKDKVDEDYFYLDNELDSLIDDASIGDKIALVKISKKDSALEGTENSANIFIADKIKESIGENTNSSNNEAHVRRARSLNYFSANSVSAGMTVTNEQDNIVYYENGVFMGRTEKFNINGKMAFCMDHSKTPPGSGVVITGVREETDSIIRKILYYGFQGPGQVSGWDANGLRAATSMAMSEYRHGDGYNLGKRLLNQVRNLAEPPAEFKAYVATLNGSWYQDLAFSEIHQIPKKGKLKIFKGTANLDVSKNNNYYETRNAEYGVYSDAGCTSLVVTLVTGDDGNSQEVELDARRYYIKEIKAPNGFHINTQVYEVDVEVNQTKNVDVYDNPIDDPIGLLIRKVDSRTGQANPSLAGAEFTVKFYAGQYADGIDPASLGVQPTRTWILKTNSNGFIYLNDDHKVSGDEFYRNPVGNPTCPMGTVTAQETRSPDGYKINPEVIVRNIKPGTGATGTTVYQVPTIQEDSLDFQIKKVQKYSDIPLPGTKFRHTKPDGSTEELVTGADGYINIYGVTRGIHKVEEIEAPQGYILNSNEFIFEVTQDNRIEVKTDINGKDMVYSENNGNGHLTVSNMVRDYKFKVIKVDNETRANLQGAEFTLYYDRALQNPVATKVTNDQGEGIFENLTPGTRYYLKETKTPDGYREILSEPREIYIDSTPIQDFFEYSVDGGKHTTSNGNVLVEGDKHDRVVGLVIENDDVELRLKKDQLNTGIPLPGVKFKHTNPDGTENELVTDANGEIVLKALKRGIHKLVEIDTISGYILNDSEFVFEVTNDNVVVSRTNSAVNMYYEDRNRDGYLAVGNLPKNYSFKITKVNNHGALLEGAEFTLYSDAGATNAIQTVTTDAQGSATFTDLVPGTKYYYKETKAPDGYPTPLNQDGSEIITEIYATSTPIQDKFSLFINGVEHTATSQDGSVIIDGDKDNRVAGMTVVNEIGIKLPETGSGAMIPLLLIGSFLMLSYVYLDRKLIKKVR